MLQRLLRYTAERLRYQSRQTVAAGPRDAAPLYLPVRHRDALINGVLHALFFPPRFYDPA